MESNTPLPLGTSMASFLGPLTAAGARAEARFPAMGTPTCRPVAAGFQHPVERRRRPR